MHKLLRSSLIAQSLYKIAIDNARIIAVSGHNAATDVVLASKKIRFLAA